MRVPSCPPHAALQTPWQARLRLCSSDDVRETRASACMCTTPRACADVNHPLSPAVLLHNTRPCCATRSCEPLLATPRAWSHICTEVESSLVDAVLHEHDGPAYHGPGQAHACCCGGLSADVLRAHPRLRFPRHGTVDQPVSTCRAPVYALVAPRYLRSSRSLGTLVVLPSTLGFCARYRQGAQAWVWRLPELLPGRRDYKDNCARAMPRPAPISHHPTLDRK